MKFQSGYERGNDDRCNAERANDIGADSCPVFGLHPINGIFQFRYSFIAFANECSEGLFGLVDGKLAAVILLFDKFFCLNESRGQSLIAPLELLCYKMAKAFQL